MIKHTWVFASYKWQGNPKALFIYMKKYHPDRECFWIADTLDKAQELVASGINAIYQDSPAGKEILAKCDVYVVENFREQYDAALNPDAVVLNLWHGVGLKHIERGVGADSHIARRMAKKHIRYNEYYRRTHIFLATSERMEDHFRREVNLLPEQIVKGPYPRNCVYQDPALRSFDFETITGRKRSDFSRVAVFAPTWRQANTTSFFSSLLPDLCALGNVLSETNTLLIVKAHPFMMQDVGYKEAVNTLKNHPNFLFWPDFYDIYEFFNEIDLAIIDYSSIFYDFLSSGIRSFIRYVPDYDEYVASEGFTDDYWSLTTGTVATTFASLCAALADTSERETDVDRLNDYFFGYVSPDLLVNKVRSGRQPDVDAVIAAADQYTPSTTSLPTLYSFDIFDTLVRRKTLIPLSVFERVGELIAKSKDLPVYLIENYTEVRRVCERDARAFKAASVPERGSQTLEVTFDEIFERMKNVFQLKDAQIARLKKLELDIERQTLEPAPVGLNRLKALVAAGEKVILLSDMYLSVEVIRSLISAVDPILGKLHIVASSDLGHKKDSGRLYIDYFFNSEYNYKEWVHFGDNKRADGVEARKLGIRAITHDMDALTPFETALVQARPKYSSYRVATLMHRYRWSQTSSSDMSFNEQRYFAYAYLGTALGGYISWVLKDAIRRGYKTLYFVPRDGHMLKTLADAMIAVRNLPLKTKLIYGSRRAWRIPRSEKELTDDLMSPYGIMAGVRSFAEFVHASQLSRADLIETVPALRAWTGADFTVADIRRTVTELLVRSPVYRHRVMLRERARASMLKDYLRQEVDLSSPFAFVEFWGRGVTQDKLSGFLNEISKKPVKNPFYYVRSIWPSAEGAVRHRFTELEFDFAFLEPVLASVSHKTIEGYQTVGDKVRPVVEWQENKFEADFMEGLRDFARDYWGQNFEDEDVLDRTLANTSYKYIRTTPSDQYICDIFGDLIDNKGMFAKLAPFAPPLSRRNILDAAVRNIPDATRSVDISLARSSPEVREAYRTKFGMPPSGAFPEPVDRLFPMHTLDQYVTFDGPALYVARQDLPVNSCVSLTKSTITENVIASGSVFETSEMVWTHKGTPRLLTKTGFVTANKSYVARLKTIVLRRPLPLITTGVADNASEKPSRFPANTPVEITGFRTLGDGRFVAKIAEGELSLGSSDFIVTIDHLDSFVHHPVKGVIALKDLRVYALPELPKKTTAEVGKIAKGRWVKVEKIVWTDDGTPLLRTETGYISAHLADVQPARADVANYFIETGGTIYLLKSLKIYNQPEFTPENLTGDVVKAGTVLENVQVRWSAEGTPRLYLQDGAYISAHLKNFRATVEGIRQYIYEKTTTVLLLEDQRIYRTTDFSDRSFIGRRLKAGSIVPVLDIAWSGKGTPRLKVEDGYISASTHTVRRVRADVKKYLFRSGGSVTLLAPLTVYSSAQFTEETKLKKVLKEGTVIPLVSIEWSNEGTPRITVDDGYISSNLKFLQREAPKPE